MNKEELKQKIINANAAYRFGEAIMSDVEFDALVDEFQKNYPNEYDSFRDSLNEKVCSSNKVHHDFIAGSLNKVKYDEPSTVIKFIQNACPDKINISAKLDGISGIAKYNNGRLISFSTRGDGYDGENILNKSPYIKFLPLTIDYRDEIVVRGELIITNEDFEDLCETKSFSNPRNASAGLLNQKEFDKDQLSHVSFIAYTVLGPKYSKDEQFNILDQLNFKTAWHVTEDVDVENIVEHLFEYACKDFGMECDGLVISSPDYHNENEYRPEKQCAFKPNQQMFETRLIDVEFSNPSKDGLFTPVGILEPVDCEGVIVSRCTLHNLDFIAEKNIKIGSKVNVLRSGNVIPKLISVIESDSNCVDIEYPEKCPYCGTNLIRDGVNLRCTNSNCPEQIVQRVCHFIKKLGCKHASIATLKNFGIKTFDDLLSFAPDKKYKSQLTFDSELKNNVFNKSKQEILAALNFTGLAETLINKIVNFYGFDNITRGLYNGGLPDGIGEITLNKFKDSILENLSIVNKFINDIRYNYLECISNHIGVNKTNLGSICFTGKLNTMSRNDASEKAKNAGFEVKGGVSRGLTYLCTNDTESGSSKNKKAKEFGTKIITEEEFLKMIENASVEENINDL